MPTAIKPSEVKIRRARSSDAARLAALSGELGYPATSSEMKHPPATVEAGERQCRLCCRKQRRSARLAARQRLLFAGTSAARRSEWFGRGGSAPELGSGCAPARRRRGLGAKEKVREHVGALQRSPRSRTRILRAPRLRALQDAESISQAAVIQQFVRPRHEPPWSAAASRRLYGRSTGTNASFPASRTASRIFALLASAACLPLRSR